MARHRRRRLHRVASRRRARPARRAGQHRRRLFDRPSRERSGRRVEVVEGDLADPGRRATRRRRVRVRAPPGGHSVRAAVGQRSGRDRIAPTSTARSNCSSPRATPASSGSCSPAPRRSTATRPSCRSARTCGRAALAVRAPEARVGEQYCQLFTQPLRARDRDDALLQRVRTAAAAGLAVLGRHLALHRGARPGTCRRSCSATASRPATSPTSATS